MQELDLEQRGLFNMIPLPRLSFTSIVDYLALAGGLAVGFALFKPVGDQIESAFRRN
tara:strand:- start:508 stop:678 length:171 start_codon:yes stop_codon:yes gene_type:complete